MGRTSAVAASSALPTVTITDSMRCRIAHLAVCPRAGTLINLVYGPKTDRETLDDYQLRTAQLWTEIAALFVNDPNWMPTSDVEYFNTFSGFDTTETPPPPGLDVATIKNTWQTLRTDWSRLVNAICAPTGASGTAGEMLYKVAWENFINGTKLSFANKPVTMYVFMLWWTHGKNLPQWCRRTLNDKAQLRMGCVLDTTSFTSPDKLGKGSSRAETPPAGDNALLKLVAMLQTRWETPKVEDEATSMPQETADAERMTALQSQLNALHAARTLNVGAGKCTAALDTAIDKVTAKLVAICE
jgi:hypothetical protein